MSDTESTREPSVGAMELESQDIPEVTAVKEDEEASQPLSSAVDHEATDPFGNYMEDLPVWLQRQPSSAAVVGAEQSEGQQYTAVLSAAIAEVAALREQLAAQIAVSQQAKEDAEKANAAATAAKAELLAYQMTAQRERTASPTMSLSSSSDASCQAGLLSLEGKEASALSAKPVAAEKVWQSHEEESPPSGVLAEAQLTLRDALDELSSISEKWEAEDRDARETLKKRGSEQRIPIEELSTLIEAKVLAAQYAFERDEAMQRSRRLRSELDHVLNRVDPADDIATGA